MHGCCWLLLEDVWGKWEVVHKCRESDTYSGGGGVVGCWESLEESVKRGMRVEVGCASDWCKDGVRSETYIDGDVG